MIKLNFSAFQIIGDHLYFSLLKCNGLYSYSLITNKVDFICYFEKEKYNQEYLHLYSLLYDDKIIFIPYMGKYIAIFEPKNNSLEYIDCDVSSHCSYIKAFIYDHELWLIPQIFDRNKRNEIRVYDLKNNIFTDNDRLNDYLAGISNYFFSFGVCSNNNDLFIALYGTNKILQINTISRKYKLIICEESIEISTVDIFGESLIISLIGSDQLKLIDLNGKFIYAYTGIHEELQGSRRLYSCVMKLKEKYFVFPQDSNDILFLDENNRKLKTVFKNKILHNSNYGIGGGQIVTKDGIVFLAQCIFDRMILIKDDYTVDFVDIKIDFGEPDKKNVLEKYLDSGVFDLNIEEDMTLEDFVDLICVTRK